MQTWQIGEAKITKVLELENLWPGFAVIPQATPDAILEHDWLLGPYADAETGRVRLSFHAFCIEVGDEKIVVDTCAGNDKVRPNFEALGGLQTDFLDRMTDAGFGPDDVTAVVCTHLHVDHVGWNTRLVDGEWVPTFPKARYLFGEREWDHWRVEPQVYGDVVGDSIQPCIDAGLADLVSSELRLNDLVWLEPTPGHTPGHHSCAHLLERRRRRDHRRPVSPSGPVRPPRVVERARRRQARRDRDAAQLRRAVLRRPHGRARHALRWAVVRGTSARPATPAAGFSTPGTTPTSTRPDGPRDAACAPSLLDHDPLGAADEEGVAGQRVEAVVGNGTEVRFRRVGVAVPELGGAVERRVVGGLGVVVHHVAERTGRGLHVLGRRWARARRASG